MKSPINAIPQLYRNVKRWTEILSILSKYGLADWISRLNIDFVKDSLKSKEGDSLARQSHERRIRMALAELGPTFIKLGQLLSTRPDLVGAGLANELEMLQDNVPPEGFSAIRTTLESELGESLEELFLEFEEQPTAAASIGQVHRARLKDGSQVAVKIQRTGVEETVRNDLEILTGLGQLAEKIEDYKPFRPRQVVAELKRTLKRELDFGREERNLFQFHERFRDHPAVDVPAPVSDLSTSRVLTMEFFAGPSLSEVCSESDRGADLSDVAHQLVDVNLSMVFDDGFFHADPHPGNILLQDSGRLVLLDFGMVGRIGSGVREDIEEMLFSVLNQDVELLFSAISRLCEFPAHLEEAELERDLSDFVGQYSGRSVNEIEISSVIQSMFEVIRQHELRLPQEAVLLLRVLVIVEGTARRLCPDFQVTEVLEPLHRKLFLRRFNPSRQYRKMRRFGLQLEKLAESMPRKIASVVDQIRTGKIDINLDHRRLSSSVNRLVYGMLASALFLGSAIMLSQKVPPLLFPAQPWLGMHQISILGLLGCLASFVLGCRLLWAIMNSGSLNRPD